MINPVAELYTAGIELMLPVLVMMMGSLLLGALVGHWYGPVPKDNSAPLRAVIADLTNKLNDAEDRLVVSATVMTQRVAIREEEFAVQRRALEQEIAALNVQLTAMKMAVSAARRPAPPAQDAQELRHVVRAMADPKQSARMTELERTAARVPALLKEVNDLYALFEMESWNVLPQDRSVTAKGAAKSTASDDLKLVDGIGPKIAEHLVKHGLRTWNDVATAKPEDLRKVLNEAGDRFHMHDPGTWPKQCRLMVEDRWEELRKYQRMIAKARS